MALPDDCKEGDYILHREVVSTVGYGKTHEEAVADLIDQPLFQEFLRRNGDRAPSLSHFTVEMIALLRFTTPTLLDTENRADRSKCNDRIFLDRRLVTYASTWIRLVRRYALLKLIP